MIHTSMTDCRRSTILSTTYASEPIEHMLHPSERQLIGTSSRRRRQTFALGRLSAKSALHAAGHPTQALLRTPSGTPAWPKNTQGSISHCGGLAVALVTTDSCIGGLGIDVEECLPPPPHVEAILKERDLDHGQALDELDLRRLSFSAREAAFKALPHTAQQSESVLDMELTYRVATEDSGQFCVRSGYLNNTGHEGHWQRFSKSYLIAWIIVHES